MITIENYQSHMVPDLWQVYFTSIRKVCIRDYTEHQVRAWAPDSLVEIELREKFDALAPFVAKLDNKIVGYADLQPDGLIDHFFVHGDYQALGVGGNLMRAILAKGSDFEKLYSHVSITAKPFFLHYGFIVEHVQEVEVRGCRMNNNLMRRARR